MSCFDCGGYLGCQDDASCDDCAPKLRASLAAVTAERDTLQRNARVEEEAYIKLQAERDALAKQLELAKAGLRYVAALNVVNFKFVAQREANAALEAIAAVKPT